MCTWPASTSHHHLQGVLCKTCTSTERGGGGGQAGVELLDRKMATLRADISEKAAEAAQVYKFNAGAAHPTQDSSAATVAAGDRPPGLARHTLLLETAGLAEWSPLHTHFSGYTTPAPATTVPRGKRVQSRRALSHSHQL